MAEARLLLALDTATRWPLVALGASTGALIAQRQWQSSHGHAEQLLPKLEELLAENGAVTADLATIVAGTGPGSFTGLRIGLATAKVLAYSLEIPIVGVSTARALALAAAGATASATAGATDGSRDIVVTLPAGAVDRYVIRFRAEGGDAHSTEPPRLVAGAADFDRATQDATLVAVDLYAAGLPPAALERGRRAIEDLAAAMLSIGARALAAGKTDDVATLVPAYVAMPRGISQSAEQLRWSPDLR